jgi:hypothetical protein
MKMVKQNDFKIMFKPLFLEPSEPPEPEKVEHETDAKLTYR